MIKVSVIIVLYNEFDLVKKCLWSVYGQKIKDLEVIIVDNSTKPTGIKVVLKKFPHAVYIKSKTNLGFGKAINLGAKKAKGEFLLFLTPDMYLMPDTINKALLYIEKNPKIGLVGYRVFSSPKKQELSVIKNYPSIKTALYYYNMPFYKLAVRINKNFNVMYVSQKDHKKIQFPKAVSGQSMLIRSAAMKQINYFDPRFFLYFEDIDLCIKLIKNNWQIAYLPIGGTVQNGISDWKNDVRITQSVDPYMESLFKFIRKYHSNLYLQFSWFVGTFSALISIFYLLFVFAFKKVLNKKTQATDLLPLFVNIIKWHFKKGAKAVF